MWIARTALICIASVLAGCASGPRVVGADVSTHTAQPPGAAVLQGAHYRFEPIALVPGQPAPARVEALAQAALARVGLVRDDAAPRVGVQVSAMVNAYWRNDWEPSNPRLALGLGYGWRGGGIGFGTGWPLYDPSFPAYVSEVSLLMRDLKTGQIVYDTRARHDGPWSDTDAVLAALFTAALQGYPQPAQGLRRVDVPLIPRDAQAPATAVAPPGNAPTPAPAPAR